MDNTRHEGAMQTTYRVENANAEMQVDSSAELDMEINPSAYEVSERAGLLHLAHGWIQRGNPRKV